MSRVFANSPGDWGPIPGRVIPKTQKMVFDAALLNTQHYEVQIKGKVEQSREWNCPPLYFGVVTIEKEPSGQPRLQSPTLLIHTYIHTYIHIYIYIYIYIYICTYQRCGLLSLGYQSYGGLI